MTILNHVAIDDVIGSCHELRLADGRSLLIDCGLFQGDEVGPDGARAERLIEQVLAELRRRLIPSPSPQCAR